MSLDLVPSCCNNECLSMWCLIEIRLFTLDVEISLRMIAEFLSRSLQ
jgi:hypothetical protein